MDSEPRTLKPYMKVPKSKVQKRADDIPDRYKQVPYRNETGKSFAQRVLKSFGEYDPEDTGPGSFFNQLKKYADREFENPR